MTLTIQDALSMLKESDTNIVAGNCRTGYFTTDVTKKLHDFLIGTLEEHERVMKDAQRYTYLRAHGGGNCISSDEDGRELVITAGNSGLDAAIDAQITKEQA